MLVNKRKFQASEAKRGIAGGGKKYGGKGNRK